MEDRFLNFNYRIARRVLRRPDGGWTYAPYSRRIYQSKLHTRGAVSFVEPVSHKQGLSPWAAVVQVDMPQGNRGHQVATYAINYVPLACPACGVSRPCAHDRLPPHPDDEVWLMNGRLKAYATVMFPPAEGALQLLFVEQHGLRTIYHCMRRDGSHQAQKLRVDPAVWAQMMAQAND
jgi:hypothetical protein